MERNMDINKKLSGNAIFKVLLKKSNIFYK